MDIGLTATQKQRLLELDAAEELAGLRFPDAAERDRWFRAREQELAAKNRERLLRLRDDTRRPAIRILEDTLVGRLVDAGFVEVRTPTMLAKGMLAKMGIDEQHPLYQQVYWVDRSTCLRPMLAPNLYHLLGHVSRGWPHPVRLFEVGSCFRKESKGSKHLSEFTMLNLVELGTVDTPELRLRELAALVMGAAGVDYELEQETSEVYGTTLDVVVGGVEVASGATGPHPLDARWSLADNWAGLGLGLERLVMVAEGFTNIRRAGRSLSYLDGARINV
ncbi:MAG: pyrrolysine--tRNA(Pyl) ligase large subunit [Deferrisomatales bacterium]